MTANPSLLPQAATFTEPFSVAEQQLFDELADEAELEAIVDALFPDDLCVKP
jgi:hypothetical protein